MSSFAEFYNVLFNNDLQELRFYDTVFSFLNQDVVYLSVIY